MSAETPRVSEQVDDFAVLRKALAWVGYNSPNESDRLRAELASQEASAAWRRMDARLKASETAERFAREVIAEQRGKAVRYEKALRRIMAAGVLHVRRCVKVNCPKDCCIARRALADTPEEETP